MTDAEFLLLRNLAHQAFDRLWARLPCDLKPGPRPRVSKHRPRPNRAYKARHRAWRGQRRRAYQWLAARLGMPVERCHFGRFDESTLRTIAHICERADPAEVRSWRPS